MNPNWKSKKYDVEFLVPHNSPLVNIIMTSTLDQNADDVLINYHSFSPRNHGVSEISSSITSSAQANAESATVQMLTNAFSGIRWEWVGIRLKLVSKIGNLKEMEDPNLTTAQVSTFSVVKEILVVEATWLDPLVTSLLIINYWSNSNFGKSIPGITNNSVSSLIPPWHSLKTFNGTKEFNFAECNHKS